MNDEDFIGYRHNITQALKDIDDFKTRFAITELLNLCAKQNFVIQKQEELINKLQELNNDKVTFDANVAPINIKL